MVATRRRCRLFSPWIEKPCSRVLRKLSGELTIIQSCADRPPPPPPDFRLRLERPGLAVRGCSSAAGSMSSATSRRLLAVQARRSGGPKLARLRNQRAEGGDLGDVGDIVPRHEA